MADFEKEIEGADRIKALRSKECFPVKNVGIILLEIFPAEEKEAMLNGLSKLFERTELPPIMKMEGILRGYWWQNIGYLVKNASHGLGATKKILPTPVAFIEVHLGQNFDFCYYLTFRCLFDPAFQGDIESGFVNPMVPRQAADYWKEKYEPKIRDCQMQIESFLSQFLKGLFLSQKIDNRLRCPSIRVLVADNIDFSNFQTWFNDHFNFLRYLGLRYPCSRFDSDLIGYQPDRLFKEEGIFAGLTFISSLEHYKRKIDDAARETLDNVSELFEDSLVPFFTVTYWAVSKLELWLADWENKASALENQMRNALADGKPFRSVKPVYKALMRLLSDFETSAIREERNISTMRRGILHTRRPRSEPLPVSGIKLDVLGDLAEGIRFVDEERDRLDFVRRKISSSFDQCKQLTDFALQSSMRNLTIVAVVLGALAVIIAVWPQLSSILAWFASFFNCVKRNR